MKPLDIVITPKGSVGIITETNEEGTKASIDFIKGLNQGDKNAWWLKGELLVVDNLPRILAHSMKHPFGAGEEDVEHFFGVVDRSNIPPIENNIPKVEIRKTLLEEFSFLIGTSPKVIKGKGKDRASTIARSLYWLLERTKNKRTFVDIGDITGHSYSSVHAGVKKIVAHLKFNYEEVLKEFRKVEHLFPVEYRK